MVRREARAAARRASSPTALYAVAHSTLLSSAPSIRACPCSPVSSPVGAQQDQVKAPVRRSCSPACTHVTPCTPAHRPQHSTQMDHVAPPLSTPSTLASPSPVCSLSACLSVYLPACLPAWLCASLTPLPSSSTSGVEQQLGLAQPHYFSALSASRSSTAPFVLPFQVHTTSASTRSHPAQLSHLRGCTLLPLALPALPRHSSSSPPQLLRNSPCTSSHSVCVRVCASSSVGSLACRSALLPSSKWGGGSIPPSRCRCSLACAVVVATEL